MANLKYTLLKDAEDLRDRIFSHEMFKTVASLPKTVDLRPHMPAIYDQGDLGSCSANAGVGLKEYYLLKTPSQFVHLSRLFLYYEERAGEGTVLQDSGATLRDCMQAMNQYGIAPEKDMPYIPALFAVPPTYFALKDASKYKISNYSRVVDLQSLKVALSAGHPVIIGIMIYDSFESDAVANSGVVPMPNTAVEQCQGGHAVLVCGFDDTKQHVIVRNSWGTEWGDHGYFYLPYSFISNSDLTTDMWTSAG